VNKIKYHDRLIEAKRLSLCSPEYVYDYLEKHASDELSGMFFETLLNRNNELIKLGLAIFCNDGEILRKLFYESASAQDGEVLRCAVFSNPHCDFGMYLFGTFKKEELKGILEKATDAELVAIMGNKSIEGHELTDIFKHSGWAENLTDEQWFSCCVYALHENPNLRNDYESLHAGYHDGMMAAAHSAALEAAWQLLQTVPLTFKSAVNLVNAFDDFPRILLHYNCSDDFFMKVFSRWKSDDPELENSFGELRRCIAAYVPSSMKLHGWMADHEDKYIRLGHYSSFDTHEPEQLEKYYVRDGGGFIKMAIYNNHLYKDDKVRKRLRELIVEHCEGFELHMFNQTLKNLEEKEPNKYLLEWEKEEVTLSQPVTIGVLKEKLEELETKLIDQIEQLRERLDQTEERNNREKNKGVRP
jgi:hypothetical protein